MPILYTRYQCAACDGVKKYMRENALPFREVNIVEDYAQAMALVQDGIRRVPVLELEDGTRYIGGPEIHEHLRG